MAAPHASRLALVVIAYLAINVAVITLAPFRFVAAPMNPISGFTDLRDVLLNIVLFVPFGFVFQLARPRRAAAAWLMAFGIGLMISGGIETAQLFAPGRHPSPIDLLTNAAGAALGAMLAAKAVGVTEGQRAVRVLALDLPLLGLTYLFLPILWLVGLSSALGGTSLLLFLMASTAWIYASVHLAYGQSVDIEARRPIRLGSGAALYAIVGLAPAAQNEPVLLIWGMLVMLAVISLRLALPAWLLHERLPDGSVSRRFEGPTLRIAVLPLVGFITALMLWPFGSMREQWTWTWALVGGAGVPGDAEIFRLMAQLSAVTALGYALAAEHGRRTEALLGLGLRALGGTALVLLPLEWARGWGTGSIASATVMLLSAAAGVLGAWIYQLQLRQIQAMIRPQGLNQ